MTDINQSLQHLNDLIAQHDGSNGTQLIQPRLNPKTLDALRAVLEAAAADHLPDATKMVAVPNGWVVHAKVSYPADEPGQRIIGWRVTVPPGEGVAASDVLPQTPFAAAPQPPSDPLQEMVDQAQANDMGYGKPVDVEAVREVIADMMGRGGFVSDLWVYKLDRAIGDAK